jgi:hypothetical protein
VYVGRRETVVNIEERKQNFFSAMSKNDTEK